MTCSLRAGGALVLASRRPAPLTSRPADGPTIDVGLGSLSFVAWIGWPASELVLAATRRARGSAVRKDRGSFAVFWLALVAGVGGAVLAGQERVAAMAAPAEVLAAVGTTLVLAGMAIRWSAVRTLGRFFTVDVAVASDHRLVDRGLYRLVRHPSYTGLGLSFVGLGVTLGSWLSLAALAVALAPAAAYRIQVEEAALIEALGDPYREYARRTKRLIPFVL